MSDMNEPYAYIEEQVTEMNEIASGLRLEAIRLTERAYTLQKRALILSTAISRQKKADAERPKEKR